MNRPKTALSVILEARANLKLMDDGLAQMEQEVRSRERLASICRQVSVVPVGREMVRCEAVLTR